jgi:hypothetical protein
VSFGGGARLVIQGNNFPHDPIDITFIFVSTYGTTPDKITVMGHVLGIDETIEANTGEDRITYYMDSLDYLFPGKFNIETDVHVQTSLYNRKTGEITSCVNSNDCKIQFKQAYSPHLFYYSTPVVYPGHKFHAIVTSRRSDELKLDNSATLTEMRINVSHCDFSTFAEADYTIPKWSLSFMYSMVGLNEKNTKFGSVTISKDIGYFYNRYGSKTCHLTAASCYQLRTVPKIEHMVAANGVSTIPWPLDDAWVRIPVDNLNVKTYYKGIEGWTSGG